MDETNSMENHNIWMVFNWMKLANINENEWYGWNYIDEWMWPSSMIRLNLIHMATYILYIISSSSITVPMIDNQHCFAKYLFI
jgi:hypothetical protein